MSVADEITRLQTAKADIKAVIEEKGVTVGDGTIDTYAEKINEIQGGGGGSFDEGYEEGMKAQYDAYWDMLQDNGKRTDYRYAFYGAYAANRYWGDEWLRPKYDIVCGSNASWMFGFASMTKLKKGYKGEEDLGLDTSAVTFAAYMFYNANNLKLLSLIDLSKVTKVADIYGTFSTCTSLESLQLRVSENTIYNGVNTATGTFYKCTALTDLRVTGTIGQNGFNVQDCPLNKPSFISVVTALSQTTSGLSITFNKRAVNNAFGINVDDPTTYPEGSEFYELRNSRNNWTFNYA